MMGNITTTDDMDNERLRLRPSPHLELVEYQQGLSAVSIVLGMKKTILFSLDMLDIILQTLT